MRHSRITANGAASDPRKETAIRIAEAHTHAVPAASRVLKSTVLFFSVGSIFRIRFGVLPIRGMPAAMSIKNEKTAQTIKPGSRRTPSAFPITIKNKK